MAFTYTVGTDRGRVRLKLSDTNAASYGFEDTEIDDMLSEGGTVNAAVILGLRTLIADAARRAKTFSVPGATYSDAGRPAELRALLKMYGGDLPTVSVITPSVQSYDSGYVEQPVIPTS